MMIDMISFQVDIQYANVVAFTRLTSIKQKNQTHDIFKPMYSDKQ